MIAVILACASTDEVCEFAHVLGWNALQSAHADELAWQPEAMDATVVWHALDDAMGAFLVSGAHAGVARADLEAVFDPIGDVEAMNAIAASTEPEELATWARRLSEFARGDEFHPATLAVIEGLLGSDEAAFVAAAAGGLARARWPELISPLEAAARRWPPLRADCERAIASIHASPRPSEKEP